MVEISAEIIPPGVYVISAVEAHPNHNNQFNYSPPQYDADYAQVITLEPSGRLSVILESPIRSPMIQIGNVQKLSDVRINKVAKPVEIGKLPYELKEIQSVKKRKELFIQIVFFNIVSNI